MDIMERDNENGRMEEDQRIYTLSREEPVKAVLRMGIPLTLGMFIMVLYNLVDTYFISLMRDDYQLAAVNLGYPVLMVMVAVSNMVGTGASSLIARCLGARDLRTANRTLTVGFLLTAALSVVIAVAGLTGLTPIVRLLGARSNTAAYTADYVQVLLIGSFFTMGSYTFGQLLRSEGSVRFSVISMVAGTIVNIILDPIFIFTLGLEIRGAAIATVLGNAVATLMIVYYYASHRSILRLSFGAVRKGTAKADAKRMVLHSRDRGAREEKGERTERTEGVTWNGSILLEIFRVGIPATLETLMTTVTMVLLNNLAVAYGELTVAAMGVSSKLMTFGSYIYQGFSAGIQPIMGYNYGAKNYKRMLRVMKAGVLVTSGIELCVMLIFGVGAPQLIGTFSDTEEVIRIGSRALRANMCILPFVGAVSISRATFQAMGKPGYALLITLVRRVVLFVPLLIGMNYLWGFTGLIWAQPIVEAIMMAVSLTLLAKVLRRLS